MTDEEKTCILAYFGFTKYTPDNEDAEWVFKPHPTYEALLVKGSRWIDPKGESAQVDVTLDLNFYDKYVFPQLPNFSICLMGHSDPQLVAFYVSLRSPDGKDIYFAEAKTLKEAISQAVLRMVKA